MPKAMKKSSRSARKNGAKKSGAKRATPSRRSPRSSTGNRPAASSKGRSAKNARRSGGTRRRTLRAARTQRPSGGAVATGLKYSKWIDSPDEHEDRKGQSLATRHHDVIRRWAEERQAVPATVESTERNGEAGILRLNFPGYGGQNLEEIGWDEWFDKFDGNNLVFLYQEHKADGSMSNFFRLNRAEG